MSPMARGRWVGCLLVGVFGCGGRGDQLRFIEAPWREDSVVVAVALGEDGRPDDARPPSVLSGSNRFELDLEHSAHVARIALLEFEARTRAAKGIERCAVSLSGTEPPLPSPNASFELVPHVDQPALEPFVPSWGENAPRFASCTPTACDAVTVLSSALANLQDWRVQGIVPVTESRVMVRLAETSSTSAAVLLLVERPSRIIRRENVPVRLSGMVRLGETILMAAQDGTLWTSDLELNLRTHGATVPPSLELVAEPDGNSAIGFSYTHADAQRVFADGRVERAPEPFRQAFHRLVLGSNARAAGARSLLPDYDREDAIWLIEGAVSRRVSLPSGNDPAEQLYFDGEELVVASKKTVLLLDPAGDWRTVEHVPAPLGQNFNDLAPLGRGYVLSGHGGLLQRFGQRTHCVLDSANHETIGPLVQLSSSRLVASWRFTVTREPNLMWIDDSLPDLE